MKLNLDTLRSEMEDYLKQQGFAVFYGYSRTDDVKEVTWDTHRHPDYKMFLDVAKQLDVRLIVLHQRQFDASLVDRAVDELHGADLEFDEKRGAESRLRELTMYDGFTCAVELSFEYQDSVYVFEMLTEWFEELEEILDQLNIGLGLDDDEDDGSFGGYYSRN